MGGGRRGGEVGGWGEEGRGREGGKVRLGVRGEERFPQNLIQRLLFYCTLCNSDVIVVMVLWGRF